MNIRIKDPIKWKFIIAFVYTGWILFALSISTNSNAAEIVGVGFTTSMMETAADEAEKLIYQYLGQLSEVKYIFTPQDKKQFFELLRKIKKTDKLINPLIIAGHGSAEIPGIKLYKDWLLYNDVDPYYLKQQLVSYKEIVKKKRLRNLDTSYEQQEVKKYSRMLKDLNSASDVMAENAIVILINCSPAATEKGRRFVRNLGKALLSKRGGTIISSKSDVSVGQTKRLFDSFRVFVKYSPLNRKWISVGDFFVSGDWVRFLIPQTRE
jgi:hypothetical protein